MIVADANLIAYLCIPGPLTASAKAVLQKDADWIAPILWRSELLSALTMHVRKAGLSLDDAEKAFQTALDVVSTEAAVSSRRVLETAHRTQCSAYDSEYVGLAEERNLKLVTNDGGIPSKCPTIAMSIPDFLAA